MKTETNSDELLHRIALTFIPGIGDVLAKNLMSYCGSAQAIFNTGKTKLLKIPGIGTVTAAAIASHKSLSQAEEELKFIQKHKITVLFYTDAAYPKRLKNCADGSALLYKRGNANFNQKKVISIVGTRNATDYGKDFCKEIIADLAAFEVLVVSGLAYGIDACAHRASLDNSLKTVAVLGHGFQTIYPGQHKKLAKETMENGALLTEFSSQVGMIAQNFAQRNRIIAGMSDAVIVIETATKGGAVITAQLANSYNRDVLALPGRYRDSVSAVCNALIKRNQAAVIESADDLARGLGWDEKAANPRPQRQLLIDLTETEQAIVDLMKTKEFVEMDDLTAHTQLNNSAIVAVLFELELKGVVCPLPGKRFRLI